MLSSTSRCAPFHVADTNISCLVRSMRIPPRWPSGKGVRLESGRPGFDSRFFHGSFSMSSHTSDLKTGAPLDTLPGAWSYRVSGRTGWPCVIIL